jgi:hypothetical protein
VSGGLPPPAYDQDGVRLYLGDCRDLLAVVREFSGEDTDAWGVERLARQARDIMEILREYQGNAQVLRAISSYLGQLGDQYGVRELHEKGQAVAEAIAKEGGP